MLSPSLSILKTGQKRSPFSLKKTPINPLLPQEKQKLNIIRASSYATRKIDRRFGWCEIWTADEQPAYNIVRVLRGARFTNAAVSVSNGSAVIVTLAGNQTVGIRRELTSLEYYVHCCDVVTWGG